MPLWATSRRNPSRCLTENLNPAGIWYLYDLKLAGCLGLLLVLPSSAVPAGAGYERRYQDEARSSNQLDFLILRICRKTLEVQAS